MEEKAIGEETAATAQAYPAPAVVAGVGRFGLAVLERLGESWISLHEAGADTGNLRLLHVRAAVSDTAPAWRQGDSKVVAAAYVIGDGDLPSQALNFVILRTLGLIRYHGSMYEVAVPVDRGIVDGPGVGSTSGQNGGPQRKRWFEWRPLNADPPRAVGLLARRIERESDLAQFVSPLIQRVRRGHAPAVLLACVSRFMALMEGRDPSPWLWSQKGREGESKAAPISPTAGGIADVEIEGSDSTREAFSDLDELTRALIEVEKGGGKAPAPPFRIKVPEFLLPRSGDLCSGFDPAKVLRVPWEVTGWATFEIESTANLDFNVLDLGWLWLGLHDGLHESECADSYVIPADRMMEELKSVGLETHRGLLALFLDMRRERTQEDDVLLESRSWLEKRDQSVEQSLDILAEFFHRDARHEKEIPIPDRADWLALPESASPPLRSAGCQARSEALDALSLLERRLHALGAGQAKVEATSELFEEVLIGADDRAKSSSEAEAGKETKDSAWQRGILDFRRAINTAAASLLSMRNLEGWRRDMLRSPPRLTVFIVADLQEPFVRASLRTILLQTHAALLRSFEPLFHSFREGFERTLSIVPILWSPQPAGAGSGPAQGNAPDSQSGSLLESAAKLRLAEEYSIVECLFEFRRTITELPRGLRCVPQIYVNSRVSEYAVLAIGDSVRQTHDFLSLHLRSDCARDEWLRELSVGPSERDLYATFGCFEAAFPGERVREYLALRLGRAALLALRGDPMSPNESSPAEAWVSPLREPAARAVKRLQTEMEALGQSRAEATRSLWNPAEHRLGHDVARDFGSDWVEKQSAELAADLARLTEAHGSIDQGVEEARRIGISVAARDARQLRERDDERVRRLGTDATLTGLEVEFARDLLQARHRVESAETERFQAERSVSRSKPPDPEPRLRAASQTVAAAALRLPDEQAQKLGIAACAILGAALLAPLVTSLAEVAGWLENPALEFLLGRGCMVAGAIAGAAGAMLWLRRVLRSRRADVDRAVQAAAEVCAGLVSGFPDSLLDYGRKRLTLGMTLAGRRLASNVEASARTELALFRRLMRLAAFQEIELRRKSEQLGVRPDPEARLEPERDDISRLFGSRSGEPDLLCDADSVVEHYRRTVGRDEDPRPLLLEITAAAGGFDEWRKTSCLGNTEDILRTPRALFENLTNDTACDLPAFSEGMGRRLSEFVSRHYSTVSTGLGHMPSGGGEETATRVLAHATLIHAEGMRRLARPRGEANSLSTPSLDRREVSIRPNVVYLLSVIQGVAASAAMPFRRYESFFDRTSHPGSPTVRQGPDEPIHILSGHKELAAKAHQLTSPPPPAPEGKK